MNIYVARALFAYAWALRSLSAVPQFKSRALLSVSPSCGKTTFTLYRHFVILFQRSLFYVSIFSLLLLLLRSLRVDPTEIASELAGLTYRI